MTIAITDLQRAVLRAAAQNCKHIAWPVPPRLNLSKGSASIVVRGLISKGLVEERRALEQDPVWRVEDGGRKLALVITKAGLSATGIGDLGEEGHASDTRAVAGDSGGIAAEAVGKAPSGAPESDPQQPTKPRTGTKLATLVELLSREEGATVEEMVAATGWQAHTVRGVMSGALAKRVGLAIGSAKEEGRGRVYRSTLPPTGPEVSGAGSFNAGARSSRDGTCGD